MAKHTEGYTWHRFFRLTRISFTGTLLKLDLCQRIVFNLPDQMYEGLRYRRTKSPFSCKNQNSKIFFRHLHLHGDLNLDEIKNAFHSLSINREKNLINLIRS